MPKRSGFNSLEIFLDKKTSVGAIKIRKCLIKNIAEEYYTNHLLENSREKYTGLRCRSSRYAIDE